MPAAKDYWDAERQLTIRAEEFSMRTGIPIDLATRRVIALHSNRLLIKAYIQGPKGRRIDGSHYRNAS